VPKCLSLLLILLAACTEAPPEGGGGEATVHGSQRLPRAHLTGALALHPTLPFRQAGFYVDGPAEGLRYQIRRGAVWTSPAPVPLTWSEGEHHVGRILLAEPADEVVLESGQPLDLHSEFWTEPQTGEDHVLTRDLPVAQGLGTLRQALAPRDLVIPREEWGARNPGLICNNPVDIYRISVHHTASPEDDGGDPALRMRQIQAYHIDNNGWCDIGYHFVVSQSGLIFEARRDERAPAAHVANQNTGNVGICFIGNYEVAEVPDAQFNAAARIMGWVRTTYGVPGNRDVIRGHQEWPGQQTACPGRNLLARLDALIALSEGGVEPPPPPPPEGVAVDFSAAWLNPQNINDQGSSAGVPDALPGQRVQVAFQLSNRGGAPLRGVTLGYALPEGLRAVDYAIETDWPARDAQTWVVNDADAAPENPPKDQLGPAGQLTLYAFGAGETKRVRITLEAGPYTGAWRPEARGFVAHIDGAYDQGAYDAEPGTNTVGARLTAAVAIDLLATNQWSFPAPEPDDLEGFSTCGPALLNSSGALVVPAEGCALSPAWTQVDADRWDSLVLEIRRAPADGLLALWWRTGDAGFGEDRALTFRVEGPGAWILPLSTAPMWRGLLDQLRLTTDGTVAVERIYPVSRARRESGSLLAPFADGPLATVVTDEPPPEAPDGGLPMEMEDAGRPPPRDASLPVVDARAPAPDAGTPQADAEQPDADPPTPGAGDAGCQSAPGPVGLPLVLVLLVGLDRRRWVRAPR